MQPGATTAQAQVEMDVIARRMELAYPATHKGMGLKVVSLHDRLYGWAERALYPLLGAVVFVLLIACVNAANLLQVRTESRRTEFALRASLGAGRSRLMRQLFVESGLLGLGGGAFGVALTFAGIRLFRALAADFPNGNHITVDTPVLLFTLAVSLVTAILVGCAPALQAARTDLNLALREGQRRAGMAGRRTRDVLAIAEIALAMVLLAGAGLMINSVLRLQAVNPGFDPSNVLEFDLSLPEAAPYVQRLPGGDVERATPMVAAFYRQLLDKVTAVPGVQAAGMITPFQFGYTFTALGQAAPAPDHMPGTGFREVSPSIFRTLKIPLVRGRSLTDSDVANALWVAVINESLARRYFPDRDPVGQRLVLRYEDRKEPQPRTIVGVMRNVSWYPGDKDIYPMVFASYLQQGTDYRGGSVMSHLAQTVMVRSFGSLENYEVGLIGAVKKAVAEIDPDQPVTGIMTLRQRLAESIGDTRFYARLFEIFATIALLLAVIGIYGSLSYLVTERTHEIGIRVAPGAQRHSIFGLIIHLGLRLGFVGHRDWHSISRWHDARYREVPLRCQCY